MRRTLDELPESLDETYERIVRDIKKPNRDHALRILQCLVVATRPLEVEELAEVLAVDFDGAEEIPTLNIDWRWEDQEQALLSSCSSLIAIVESDESRIVQFSHFSVKEFLTSTRLATSSGSFSYYHIALEPAHVILAQACMSVLVRLDNSVEQSDLQKSSPLARYAAKHWVAHVQFGNASSCLLKAMEFLFNADMPYFEAWLQLHDMDTESSGSAFFPFTTRASRATPLYYAALCGFQDLVKLMIANTPEHVNATGGWCVTPLIAALKAGHFQTAKFLRDNGAHPNVTGFAGRSPLHAATWQGDLEMVQVLLKYKADVDARDVDGGTPLHYAYSSYSARPNAGPAFPEITRLLLEHGADVNAQNSGRFTPLHNAAGKGNVEVVRVLLEYGADVGVVSDDLFTALHVATLNGKVEVVRVLLKHGADVCAEIKDGRTALELASDDDVTEIKKLLLEHGAR